MNRFSITIALALFCAVATAQVKVGNNPTAIGTNSNLEVEATNGNKIVVTKDGGNVGVNTITPLSALHVIGAVRSENSQFAKYIWNSSANAADKKKWQAFVNPDGTWHLATLNDAENVSVTRLAVTSNGNVGIGGAVSPTQKLDINGLARAYASPNPASGNTSSAILSSDGGIELNRGGAPTSPGGYIDFKNDPADPDVNMRLALDGNVGDPSFTFSYSSNGTSTSLQQIASLNKIGTWSAAGDVNSGGSINANGGFLASSRGTFPTIINKCMIGWDVINPGSGEVDLVNARGTGGSDAPFRFHSYNGISAPTNATVIATISSAGAWNAVSDARVKSNIQGINYGLKEIMALRPVSYLRHLNVKFENDKIIKSDEGINSIGLLAQEVYKVVPEAVTKPVDDKNELWAVGYSTLVPVLTKAIQEQQAQIEAQNAEIEELKATVKQLIERK